MADSWGFIVKLLIVSALLAIAIKTVAPELSVPETNMSALLAVTLPPLGVGIALGWRAWQGRSPNQPESKQLESSQSESNPK